MTKRTEKQTEEKTENAQVFNAPLAMTKEAFQADQKAVAEMEQTVITQPVQQMRTQYTTAVRVVEKRNISLIMARVKNEIEFDPDAMFYRWLVTDRQSGRKVPIKGGSIGLAMTIARNFGNCAIPVTVQETPTHYIFFACFIDLETGFTLERSFRQRKAQNIGEKYDSERKEDIAFQIGQSKAIRNVVLASVPRSIVNKSVEFAISLKEKEWTSEKKEGLRERLLLYFKALEVTEKMIGNYFDKPDSMTWTIDDMISLGSIKTSIESSEYSASFFFPELKIQKEQESGQPVPVSSGKDKKPESTPKESDGLFTSNYLSGEENIS